MSLEWVGFVLIAVSLVVIATSLVAWLTMGGILRSARERDERLEALHEEVDLLLRALPDLSGTDREPERGAASSRGVHRRRRDRRRPWWRRYFGL